VSLFFDGNNCTVAKKSTEKHGLFYAKYHYKSTTVYLKFLHNSFSNYEVRRYGIVYWATAISDNAS